jgi:hypothetical protein
MKSAKEWLDELPPEPIRPCMAQEWTDWSRAVIRYCEAIQRDALEAAAVASESEPRGGLTANYIARIIRQLKPVRP